MHIDNCEGLTFLTWDMFDSPDLPESGYKYMEREPVYILDEIIRKTRATIKVTLGYVTKPYGDKIRLVNTNSLFMTYTP